MPYITVPKELREKLGEAAAGQLVDILNRSEAESRENTIDLVEQRFRRHLTEEVGGCEQRLHREIVDMGASLREEMAEMGSAIRGEMHQMGSALRGEMAEMGSAIRQEMAEMGSDLRGEMTGMDKSIRGELAQMRTSFESSQVGMIRWMFAFWVGQIAVLGGLFVALSG